MAVNSASGSETVLVAEDEPDIRRLYGIWLGQRWCLRFASDGAEAIEAFDQSVSIALLDGRMPKATGEDVARHIRERSSCPIAMISADTPSPRILSQPLDVYLCKPVTRDDVDRVVEQLFALRTFDECVREYFTLTAKLSTLHSQLSIAELESDPEYRRACERIDALSSAAAEALAELDDPNPAHETLMREFTR